VHPVADGQVVDSHGIVVVQSSFGIQFRFPIQSCGLPVRRNPARVWFRFRAATKPQHRQAYQRVVAILNQMRERILAEAKIAMTAPARGNSTAAIDFIQLLNEGRSANGVTPRPRRPAAGDDRLRLAPAERRAGIAGKEIERISPGRDTLKARTFLVLT
jgi:hypothetical protein